MEYWSDPKADQFGVKATTRFSLGKLRNNAAAKMTNIKTHPLRAVIPKLYSVNFEFLHGLDLIKNALSVRLWLMMVREAIKRARSFGYISMWSS